MNLTPMNGIQYLGHCVMLFIVKMFVIKLLKCKINLTLICYIIPRKLTISSDIKAIRIQRN